MVIELRVVQFWSEIILVISIQLALRARSIFEITRMILDQIALHLVQLPLLITLVHLYSDLLEKRFPIKVRVSGPSVEPNNEISLVKSKILLELFVAYVEHCHVAVKGILMPGRLCSHT